MFRSARITLTAWYVLIAFLITLFFSVIAYRSLWFDFQRSLQRQRVIIMRTLPQGQQIISQFPDLMEDVQRRLIMEIVIIDAVIIAIFAAAGYFFAGRALRPIQEMVEEQNRFVSDSSHELRTPLTALRTSIEVNLRDRKLTLEKAKSLLQENLEEVTNLQTLSDSLLALAQYQNTPTEALHRSLKIMDILEEAKRKVHALAEAKKIAIAITGRDCQLRGDDQTLVELFVILLDNAIKYSSENSEISVSTEKIDGFIAISVADHGIGIAEKDMEHIFDRFYRADKSRSREGKKNGYGLGLSIAQSIVEAHNGEIEVESEAGEGSTFTVKLPATRKV
jgi:signal transduction histidine kinase